MGAVAYLPFAYSPSGTRVAIWDGAHRIVDRSTGVNVVCEISRLNGRWYKLATGADIQFGGSGPQPSSEPGRYVSAALTTLQVLPGYVWGTCTTNTDQPGRRFPTQVVVTGSIVAALIAAGVIIRRRRAHRTS